ncbi:unnamed protein product [Tetraodon nigroviridis]|uniref:(spotted green pufferfish) hypothetical protein n=1 Tax=Tetraodon nigroviridis TaxID=99883 RepID=Q4SPE0_TETNG|nr:unnamed protein product [Tetraodon nigroviridis]
MQICVWKGNISPTSSVWSVLLVITAAPRWSQPPIRSSQTVTCRPGTYKDTMAGMTCVVCPAGTYGAQEGLQKLRDCTVCPAGHYCPPGTMFPTQYKCPVGTWSGQSGMETERECKPCPQGCSTFRNLKGGQRLEDCFACPAGYFCPRSATVNPRVCGAGSFSDEGSSECSPCLKGHYCSNETTSEEAMLSAMVCPPGFLCSQGLAREPQRAFSVQKVHLLLSLVLKGRLYCNSTGLSQPSGVCNTGAEMCENCPAGTYCLSGEGVQLCPAGHYCLGGGVEGILPCPPGTYSPLLGLSQVEQCLICPAGFFCEEWGLFEPTGPCPAGFYCIAAAWNSQPFDLDNYTNANCLCPATSTGGRCQVGFYCPLGSPEPLPCPPGSFCNMSGYWCPPGQTVDTALPCPSGHFCSQGSAAPEPCPPGTYQDREKQADCAVCVAGTFNPRQAAHSPSDCMQCDAGQHCPSVGLAEPAGPCHAGYWCRRGASSPAPLDGLSGSLCPPGHYCPPGITAWGELSHPLPVMALQGDLVPKGFTAQREQDLTKDPAQRERMVLTHATGLLLSAGSVTVDDCLPCLPGYYCDAEGLSAPSGPCWEGFFCLKDVCQPSLSPRVVLSTRIIHGTSVRAVGHLDPVLLAASFQNLEPLLLLSATPAFLASTASALEVHNLQVGMGAGHYCHERGMAKPSGLCADGYYCPKGQISDRPQEYLCSEGQFCEKGSVSHDSLSPRKLPAQQSEQTGLVDESQCRRCSPGFYCSEPGLSAVSGPCLPGECLMCPVGQFCASEGLVEPSGPCAAGFLCLTGATAPNPNDNRTGSPCPPGSFCQQGQRAGNCWAGFYCNLGASRPDETLCPTGSFCPSGTPDPVPCPAGTFSSNVGNSHQDNCTICPPGHYCEGLCEAGYYCPAGSASPNVKEDQGHSCPTGSMEEVPCEPGTYNSVPGAAFCRTCPEGSVCASTATQEPSICPAGQYCSTEGLARPSGPCAAGFYCPFDFSSTTPYTFLCPKGHYCPEGSALALPCPTGTMVPQPCPNGTYTQANQGGLQAERECSACPPGKFCRFAHVFSERGKYVFVDGAVPEWSTVVVVSEEGAACNPRSSVFQPMTPEQLVRHGIVKQHRLNLLPDWGVIVASQSAFCDLEEFNVKTLYDKLEDQTLHIASQLAQHRKDVQEFYRNICQQAESLRNVFEAMDVKKLSLLRELLLTKSMADNRDSQDHLQSTAPCINDHELSDLLSISPLFKTLQEIQSHLQDFSSQHLHNGAETQSTQAINTPHSSLHAEAELPEQESNNGSLIPTPLDRLSPQHSAVFLFGCQVMQLLSNRPPFPSVLLLLAKSLPVSNLSDGALLAACSGEFHFDSMNQILYLSEAQLGHVGHFLATLLQSIAYISSGFKSTITSNWNNLSQTSNYIHLRTQTEMTFIEEEIDRLNESFLHLSVQLQRRLHADTRSKVTGNSAGSSFVHLNELQIRLDQIKRCQQCDGESKEATRGLSQRDGGSTRQGAGQQLPDIDGCSPTDGLWQDRVPACQSPGQKTIMSLSESHISGPESSSGDTRSDGQAVVDGSGQQGAHGQIAIKNMAEYSDATEMS